MYIVCMSMSNVMPKDASGDPDGWRYGDCHPRNILYVSAAIARSFILIGTQPK